jgi:2TM family of unknown function (DUF5676)
MKLEAARLGLAVGIGSAIVWTICSLLVALMPEPSLALTRSLFHVASGGPVWGVTWAGYLVGLCVWSVGSGLFAWFCAGFYNRMLPARER